MRKVVATICLGFFLVNNAAGEMSDMAGQAVFFSGNDVHSWCREDRPMALAYTAGLWDATVRSAFVIDTTFRGLNKVAEVQTDFGLERLGGFCGPKSVTAGQVTDVFCAHIRNTPEKRERHASLIFSEAMEKAWPCKKR
jgi:hypothetical protein